MPVPCAVLPSAPVLFAIVPPVPETPLPATVSPPLAPVAFTMMPLDEPPFDEMLRNVIPLPPIVVFATFSAVPLVVASVLMMLELFWVTLTVPPPVAVNAVLVPVLRATPPVKLIVAPVLLVRLMPRLLVLD